MVISHWDHAALLAMVALGNTQRCKRLFIGITPALFGWEIMLPATF